MTTEKFVDYLNKNLLTKNNVTFNTKEWIYNPGIPENQAVITSDKFENVIKNTTQILNGFTVNPNATKDWKSKEWLQFFDGKLGIHDIDKWTTQEWVHLVRNLPTDITIDQMQRLDNAFNFTNSTNSYIAMVWYEQSINHDYHGNNVDTKIEEFLTTVGRRWYVSTIFKAFKKNNKVDEALTIYKKSRPNYHSVTANTIDVMLGYKEE